MTVKDQPRTVFAVLIFVAACSSLSIADELTFERDIRPIFRAHCFDCHGASEVVEGSLDLRLVRFMVAGGDSGTALERGSAEDSLLLQRIKDGEMPPGDHPVPADQIATIERWIESGAATARPEPASLGPGLGITPEERAYWAYQPIMRTTVPEVTAVQRVRTPVDAFLLAELEPKGLSFAEDADKTTLIRRAYLDLIGLPPTPEQIQAFLADESEQAWDSLIDELLESPRYGERWGRHWLDVAGYADSEGASNRDEQRPWSFRYRDWVIRSLNQDMPFDQFITWQLAGDELVEAPYKNLSNREVDQLTATGYLRMAADPTTSNNDDLHRNQVMTDTLKIVSSSLLGLSVGCAQCHDHRYDPISQADYYRLRAVFEPALNYRKWQTPPGRRLSMMTDAERSKVQAIEEQVAPKLAARNEKQAEFMEAALQKELSRFEESLRAQLEAAYRADPRNDEQKALLEEHPSIGKLHPGVLYQYNQGNADKLKAFDKEIADIRSQKPAEEFIRVLTEPTADAPPETQLFYRGDYRQPKQAIAPGGLTIAAPDDAPFEIAFNDSQRPTSGRRLAYARWLTSGRHPLVARVLVNRFWLHHFGQTFVSTPDEFGQLGTSPTHPELLDWLADEFMAKGWSLKHLHRLIMRSTVYRQQSLATELSQQVDGSNQLYGHFPIRRLEAETIRDAILFVSDRLDDKMYGPAVAVSQDDTGQVITSGDRQRRSVYLQVRRSQPVAFLKSFDAPVMDVNCGKREISNVPTQALMMMNSDFVLKSSAAFAKRLETMAGSDVSEQLRLGWQLAYGHPPSSEEIQLAEKFLHDQKQLLVERENENPEQQALTNYCQTLLSSNQFLYME